jgi:hypothetical protein
MTITALSAPALGAEKLATILLPRDREIALALEAGPEHLRAGAAVYVFGAKGYEQARAGSNGIACLVNRDGNQAGDNDLKPTCWDAEGTRTLLPVALRVGELIASGTPAAEIKKDIDTGFESGRFSSPSKAGIAYMLKGDLGYDPATGQITKTLFPPHYMIYAPGVTNADIGIDAAALKSNAGLPRIYAGYSGGPRTAYLIVPAAPGGHGH